MIDIWTDLGVGDGVDFETAMLIFKHWQPLPIVRSCEI